MEEEERGTIPVTDVIAVHSDVGEEEITKLALFLILCTSKGCARQCNH